MHNYFTKAERDQWVATWYRTIGAWQRQLRQER
jgi:hypothetical protein